MKKIVEDLLALQTLELNSSKKDQPEALALRKQIPAGMLLRFDSFMSRGKKAVAVVQNGVCKGCQIKLPVGVVNSLIMGLSAPTCDNCGRYLCLLPQDILSFQERNKTEPIRVKKAVAPGLRKKAIRPSKARSTTP